MKNLKTLMLAAIFIVSAAAVSGQKLKSGDVKVLNGQKVLNLQYDYSKMAVGKFKNEKDYVEDGIIDRNKKKPGTGDDWGKKWVSDRQDRFQPMFEKNLNNKIDIAGVFAKENAENAKYTLICRTTFTEPGFNVGVMSKKAFIDMEVDVVETANPGTVLATIALPKQVSTYMGGYDFDTGARIQSCYDRAGDNLGNFLVKKALK